MPRNPLWWMIGLVFLSLRSAYAVDYEGQQMHAKLLRAGKSLRGEASLAATVSADVFRVTSEEKKVRETVYKCEDELKTDGTRGAWKSYLDVGREGRAAWLAQNIKGLNLTTAKRLVDDRYFDEIPFSWQEFKRRIRLADDTYQTGFSYEVLIVNKEANLVDLGYMVAGQCSFTTEKILHKVPVRKFHRKATRAFELRVRNAPLLLNEREHLTISFDGTLDSLVIASEFYAYTVERREADGRVVYELTGKRKLVRPANSLTVQAGVVGGELVMRVSDENFDAEVSPGLDRKVVGTVTGERSWRGGKSLGGFEFPLAKDSAWTEIKQTGIRLKPGAKVLIGYELRIVGSPYYGEQASVTKTTRLDLSK